MSELVRLPYSVYSHERLKDLINLLKVMGYTPVKMYPEEETQQLFCECGHTKNQHIEGSQECSMCKCSGYTGSLAKYFENKTEEYTKNQTKIIDMDEAEVKVFSALSRLNTIIGEYAIELHASKEEIMTLVDVECNRIFSILGQPSETGKCPKCNGESKIKVSATYWYCWFCDNRFKSIEDTETTDGGESDEI